MSSFGGASAFFDGKYNITNDFGGTLYEYRKRETLSLMKYIVEINGKRRRRHGLFSTAGTKFKKLCTESLEASFDASVRHLGTDINYVVLGKSLCEAERRSGFSIRHGG